MGDKDFLKTYSSLAQLIELLESRGLYLEDKVKTESYLNSIGYFRLSAYTYPLLAEPKSEHRYKPNASFSKVLNLYRFDRKFRILLFNEIEKIEVAIRSTIVNTGCEHYSDVFWMTKSKNFFNQQHVTKYINDLKFEIHKSSEDFIIHFVNKYNEQFPPSWCVAEILSLGTLCHLYKNISDRQLRKSIALKFGLQPAVFESWILTIAGVRNICCHHSRIWNKVFKLKPIAPNKTTFAWLNSNNSVEIQKVYYRICIIKYLLQTISPNNTLKAKLLKLLGEFPETDIFAMGFTPNWEQEPLWNK